MTLQVGDAVRVKAPDDGTAMSDTWRETVGWVGTVHSITEADRYDSQAYTVTFGERAKDGFWTYPPCGLERVEPEAPSFKVGDTVRVKPPENALFNDLRWEDAGACGRVVEIDTGPDHAWLSVDLGERSPVYFSPDRVERVALETTGKSLESDFPVPAPLTVHLDAAIASLRQALEVAAPDGSMDRLVALTGLIGHVERCVRELPE